MEHFIKKFTVIDFLSMFVPGGILVLAWNYYVGGVAAPAQSMSGDNEIFLALYFIMVSYITGMVLQDISKPLEILWQLDIEELEAKWKDKLEENYKRCFGESIFSAAENGEDISRNIYLYVSDTCGSESKRDLFHAFSSMGRNCAAAGAIVPILYCVHTKYSVDYTLPIISLAFAVIMAMRNRRFFILTQERAYRDFLKICVKESAHQDSTATT